MRPLVAALLIGLFAGTAAADKLSLKGERLLPKAKQGRLTLTLGDGGKQLVVIAPPVWCKPCATQLAWLQKQSAKLAAAGIRVIALVPTTEEEDHSKLKPTLARLGLTFEVVVIEEADTEALMKLSDEVPASILFENGRHEVLVHGWSAQIAATLTTKLGLDANAAPSAADKSGDAAATPPPSEMRTIRTELAVSIRKLAADAATLATSAEKSKDAGARTQFAPLAIRLRETLTAVAGLLDAYMGLKLLGGDMKNLGVTASDLVDAADEIDNKALRKSLRAKATTLGKQMAKAKTAIDAAITKEASIPPTRFTGRLINSTDKCGSAESLKFEVTRDGALVLVSNQLAPGKEQSVELDEGPFLIQVRTADKLITARNLNAFQKDWTYESGCTK